MGCRRRPKKFSIQNSLHKWGISISGKCGSPREEFLGDEMN